MKKYFIKAMTILFIVVGVSFNSEAQIVVRFGPPAPVRVVRPACPSSRHVWIDGNYAWRNNRYVWTNGYWTIPPKRGHYWSNGNWKHKRNGWGWTPGRWRR